MGTGGGPPGGACDLGPCRHEWARAISRRQEGIQMHRLIQMGACVTGEDKGRLLQPGGLTAGEWVQGSMQDWRR
jgi:hypothetical protein